MADNRSFKKKERKLLLQPKQRSDKSEDSFELLPFENLCVMLFPLLSGQKHFILPFLTYFTQGWWWHFISIWTLSEFRLSKPVTPAIFSKIYFILLSFMEIKRFHLTAVGGRGGNWFFTALLLSELLVWGLLFSLFCTFSALLGSDLPMHSLQWKQTSATPGAEGLHQLVKQTQCGYHGPG